MVKTKSSIIKLYSDETNISLHTMLFWFYKSTNKLTGKETLPQLGLIFLVLKKINVPIEFSRTLKLHCSYTIYSLVTKILTRHAMIRKWISKPLAGQTISIHICIKLYLVNNNKDVWNYQVFWNTNGSPNPSQKTRSNVNQQEKNKVFTGFCRTRLWKW